MPLLNTAEAVYAGDAPVKAVYLGVKKIWPPGPDTIPGLAAWFDPAQDSFANGERITSYTEHSPNRRVFAGLSAGAEPVLRAGAAPYLEFQGSGHLQFDTWNAGPVGFTFVAVNSLNTPVQPMMLITHHTDVAGYEMRWDNMHMMSTGTWSTNFVNHQHSVADVQDVKQVHIYRFDVSKGMADSWVGEVQDTFLTSTMPNIPT